MPVSLDLIEFSGPGLMSNADVGVAQARDLGTVRANAPARKEF